MTIPVTIVGVVGAVVALVVEAEDGRWEWTVGEAGKRHLFQGAECSWKAAFDEAGKRLDTWGLGETLSGGRNFRKPGETLATGASSQEVVSGPCTIHTYDGVDNILLKEGDSAILLAVPTVYRDGIWRVRRA